MSTAFWVMMALIFVFVLLVLKLRKHRLRIVNALPVTPNTETRLARKTYRIGELPPRKELLPDDALGLIRRNDANCMVKPCRHLDEPRAVSYEVFGTEFGFPVVARCPPCMQALFEATFERCAVCDKGITYTQKVAIAWVGAPRPYTHIQCAEVPTLMCGMWGWGQLLPLHGIGDQFAPGTATIMQHALTEQANDYKKEASAPAQDAGEEAETEPTPVELAPKPGVN